jgi:pSer/pThr/pTyr-binding forkhead associated (FHA) protein
MAAGGAGKGVGRVVPRIVVLNGACEGAVFALSEIPTVVGRSPESHVQIGDPWISSMHALFERRGEEIWVVDLDSRNGTYIGDARVTETQIGDGAVVRFGQTEVRVALAGGAAAPAPAAEPADRLRPREQRGTVRAEATLSTRSPLVREPVDDPWALARRRATVLRLAIDAAGIEDLPGAPERLRGALEAAARAALDSGAVVTRLGGVGVLALYGLSGPAPDDATRALGAARSARREVRGRGGLDVRAAFDTGVVLAGDAGTAGFELAALGPAAERVERLLAVARRGEILAGPGAAEAGGLSSGGLRAVGETEIEVFVEAGGSDPAP